MPNDHEKRKALKSLPPDLFTTYVRYAKTNLSIIGVLQSLLTHSTRIFERIDEQYPTQTTIFIRRALIWVATSNNDMSLDMLCRAISIEPSTSQLDEDSIPSSHDMKDWLSILISFTPSNQRYRGPTFTPSNQRYQGPTAQLSHFTVKEFLLGSLPGKVVSPVAQTYLIQTEGRSLLVESMIAYLVFVCAKKDSQNHLVDSFLTSYIWDHLEHELPQYDHTRAEPRAFQEFFTYPTNSSFKDWTSHARCLHEQDTSLSTAVHFLLPQTCARLLASGSSVREMHRDQALHSIPLILTAMGLGHGSRTICRQSLLNYRCTNSMERQFEIVSALLDHGADISATEKYTIMEYSYVYLGPWTISVMCLALIRGNVKVCELLMERGASIAPETTGLSERYDVYRVFLQSRYFNYSDAHYMRSEMLDLLKKVAAKVKLFDEGRLHLKTADEQGVNPKITVYEPLEACKYSGADQECIADHCTAKSMLRTNPCDFMGENSAPGWHEHLSSGL